MFDKKKKQFEAQQQAAQEFQDKINAIKKKVNDEFAKMQRMNDSQKIEFLSKELASTLKLVLIHGLVIDDLRNDLALMGRNQNRHERELRAVATMAM